MPAIRKLPSLCIAVLLGVCVCSAAEEGAHLPNIVLILADDLGYGSAGCYGADPTLIRTPAIDRLAREGRRFTQAHTPSSVCTPTRYALLTGRYCWRTRLDHGGVLNTRDPLLIEPGRPTVASMLKLHGYRTAMVGKWHLGYGTLRRVDYTKKLAPGPLELGFDYQFAVPQNHNDVTRVFVENHHVFGLRSTTLTPSPGNLGLDAPQRDDPKTMEVLTTRAVDWLKRQAADHPFFLYFAPVAVHELVTPSPATQGTSAAGPYGDFIHDLDLSVGRILKALDELGCADRTLVVFTSDNGGVINPRSKSGSQKIAMDAGLAINGLLRGGKHDVWEGGFRVPFIVRWPGHVPAGSTSDALMNLVDIYATCAAVVGHTLEEPQRGAGDGFNVLSAMLGEAAGTLVRDAVVLQSADGVYAIRSGNWKWIDGTPIPRGRRTYGPRHPRRQQFSPQLFDLGEDPAETRNVAQEHPGVARRLADRLAAVRKQPARTIGD